MRPYSTVVECARMAYDPKIHHRRSIRLKGYDYARPGWYFVTVCTERKVHTFGEVVEGQMYRNSAGEIVATCWRWLETRYPQVKLDEWAVMPNHLHGIIVMGDGRGGSRTAPTKALGRLIGAFKTASTNRVNAERNEPGTRLWQRDYYERIIRNDRELEIICDYIRTNPQRWATDPENPDAKQPAPAPWLWARFANRPDATPGTNRGGAHIADRLVDGEEIPEEHVIPG